MSKPYRSIQPDLARRLRLIVTDVDGTITAPDDSLYEPALDAIRRLEASGISVGFATGRTLDMVESIVRSLGATGPVVAENGGIARLSHLPGLVDLGYSNAAGIKALEKLMAVFPGRVSATIDGPFRKVDVGICAEGLTTAELLRHLEGVELLDSGFMLHLLPPGMSKGRTLALVLERMDGRAVSADEVMVFGDSPTDASLFERFSHSVLVRNPRIPAPEELRLEAAASYHTSLPFGDGFVEVAAHILALRGG